MQDANAKLTSKLDSTQSELNSAVAKASALEAEQQQTHMQEANAKLTSKLECSQSELNSAVTRATSLQGHVEQLQADMLKQSEGVKALQKTWDESAAKDKQEPQASALCDECGDS